MGSGVQTRQNPVASLRDKKQRINKGGWTEDERKQLLRGLAKYSKDDPIRWVKISRHCVTTRTNNQVCPATTTISACNSSKPRCAGAYYVGPLHTSISRRIEYRPTWHSYCYAAHQCVCYFFRGLYGCSRCGLGVPLRQLSSLSQQANETPGKNSHTARK